MSTPRASTRTLTVLLIHIVFYMHVPHFCYTNYVTYIIIIIMSSLCLYIFNIMCVCVCMYPMHEENRARDRTDRNYGRFTFSGHTWLVPFPTPLTQVSLVVVLHAAAMLFYIPNLFTPIFFKKNLLKF